MPRPLYDVDCPSEGRPGKESLDSLLHISHACLGLPSPSLFLLKHPLSHPPRKHHPQFSRNATCLTCQWSPQPVKNVSLGYAGPALLLKLAFC